MTEWMCMLIICVFVVLINKQNSCFLTMRVPRMGNFQEEQHEHCLHCLHCHLHPFGHRTCISLWKDLFV